MKFVLCWFLGHFYRPCCHYAYSVRGKETPRSRHTRQRYQYTCERCGFRTKQMTRTAHRAFLRAQCPTWGPRGSDSNGYRKDQ